jgi:Ca2+-binding EF-hand superfamily protein
VLFLFSVSSGEKRRVGVRKHVRGIGIVVALGIALGASQTVAGYAASLLRTIDTDNDGTIDLNEAKAAAARVFDRLERDNDGTLDARELKGRLSAKEFAAADPDHDGTLTKDEYLALVEQRFKAANTDADDTIDAKEFGSKAGHALQRLVN